MAFDEIRFPEAISYNSQRGPEYVTTIYENETHVEHRIGRTPVGRLRYIVSKDLLTISDIQTLEVFFRGASRTINSKGESCKRVCAIGKR